MSKKQSSKKQKKPTAQQQSKSQAKTRPRVQTDADLPEDQTVGLDQAIGPDEPTQSGDTQGLSGGAEASFESVKELVEEGQYLEAEVIDGVENAPDSDAGPVKTREVPEDDVPAEYRAPNRERQS